MRWTLPVAVLLAACSTDVMPQADPWPFSDAPHTAVLSTKSVTSGTEPIIIVSHDADDGAWQFLGAQALTEDSASVVALSTIMQLDPSVASLADLPLGWYAQRDSASGPWRRIKAE